MGVLKRVLSLYWILLKQAHAFRKRESFQHFFPDVEEELQNAIHLNCSGPFQLYKNEQIYLYGQHCVKTFSCVMQVATE